MLEKQFRTEGDTVPVGPVSARSVLWSKTGVKERRLSVNLKSERVAISAA